MVSLSRGGSNRVNLYRSTNFWFLLITDYDEADGLPILCLRQQSPGQQNARTEPSCETCGHCLPP